MCLSCCFSALGMLIINKFDYRKIISDLNQSLQKELQDLEVLNQISHLEFQEVLHQDVNSRLREQCIKQFVTLKVIICSFENVHVDLK